MFLNKLNEALKTEPAYRLKQARELIFKNLISDWNEATNLSLALREKLNKECALEIPAQFFVSKNKRATKALVTLEDGLKIETVLMRSENANTVCVSTQVGCAIGCLFCATGKMGFKRSLTSEEIVAQVLLFARYLKKPAFAELLRGEEKITNVVFMGMGEPMLNYDNVLEAIKILNDKTGMELGSRRFSISTAGIVEGIQRLADEKMEINLAVSLNAADDRLRSELMPINNQYSLKKVLAAVDDYLEKTRRKVFFEYVLIAGVNDSQDDARKLAGLLRGKLCAINLIPYNFTGKLKAPDAETIGKFTKVLMDNGLEVTQRYRYGTDIKAACGQLATK
ncbi:MAG: 23S rRNA (adenine(2503)-C(2))-methyltransferase RlmN [Candidatus Falkowbacteria bacterium]